MSTDDLIEAIRKVLHDSYYQDADARELYIAEKVSRVLVPQWEARADRDRAELARLATAVQDLSASMAKVRDVAEGVEAALLLLNELRRQPEPLGLPADLNDVLDRLAPEVVTAAAVDDDDEGGS